MFMFGKLFVEIKETPLGRTAYFLLLIVAQRPGGMPNSITINPQLKIVPNKCTISFCMGKVCLKVQRSASLQNNSGFLIINTYIIMVTKLIFKVLRRNWWASSAADAFIR